MGDLRIHWKMLSTSESLYFCPLSRLKSRVVCPSNHADRRLEVPFLTIDYAEDFPFHPLRQNYRRFNLKITGILKENEFSIKMLLTKIEKCDKLKAVMDGLVRPHYSGGTRGVKK